MDMELRRVNEPPDAEQALSDIPRALGFVLTRLLSHDRALLHAEHRRPEPAVTWYVRRRSESAEGEEVPVAALPSGTFTSMVTRVALLFGVDYRTGGRGRGILSFEGRRFDCVVFLSRRPESGSWIRLYAAAL